MSRKFISKFCFASVLLFIYIPIIIVAVFSFNETKSKTVFSGFTLNWFLELFKDRTIIGAFFNSLILSVTSSIAATVIGVMAALNIVKFKRKSQTIFLNLNYIPIINSDIVIGVSLMLFFTFITNLIGGQLGFLTVLIAHITISLPYVVILMIPKIRQLDKNILNAALDLGCSPNVAFFKVILPQLFTGIVYALVMAFSISFDDFTISYFTAGSNFQTLPVLIYSMVRRRITPKINALFTLIFIFALVILIFVNFLNNHQQKIKSKQ